MSGRTLRRGQTARNKLVQPLCLPCSCLSLGKYTVSVKSVRERREGEGVARGYDLLLFGPGDWVLV